MSQLSPCVCMSVELLDQSGHSGFMPKSHHSGELPLSPRAKAEYLPRSGNWSEVQKLVAELGFPVVLKPLKGTGGLDVIRATCWREVEGAVQSIFGREYGLAVSPYKRIVDEYRCICLDGSVELVYRKASPRGACPGACCTALVLETPEGLVGQLRFLANGLGAHIWAEACGGQAARTSTSVVNSWSFLGVFLTWDWLSCRDIQGWVVFSLCSAA